MAISVRDFGKISDGRDAHLYTITNQNGNSVSVTDFGAIIVSINLKDKNEIQRDVVLGYDTAAGYQADTNCFGATIGRCCNRTAGASFSIDGKEYHLLKNEGENNLHSSMTDGFHKVLWNCVSMEENTCVLEYVSPAMENGFPGELTVQIAFSFTDENELVIEYSGKSTESTVFNPTNHSYFNLGGESSGAVLDQLAYINSDRYLEANLEKIPTGRLVDVAGTPMDLREFKKIGDGLAADYKPLVDAGGYDHCFEIKGADGMELIKCASAYCTDTGISMDVYTDCPGVQFYTCNYDEPVVGKNGYGYAGRTAFCFETSYYPNALNQETFESPVIAAGTEKKLRTEYRFKIG